MTRNAQTAARIRVIVKPRSSRQEVEVIGDALVVRVTAPPAEGKANEMCLALVSGWLGIPKSQLTILRGLRQREKIIGVAGLDQAQVDRRLLARTAKG